MGEDSPQAEDARRLKKATGRVLATFDMHPEALARFLSTVVDPQWRARRACAGLPADWFVPEGKESEAKGLGICPACPVRAACLLTALREHHKGIWGSTTRRQRADLKRALKVLGLDELLEGPRSPARDQADRVALLACLLEEGPARQELWNEAVTSWHLGYAELVRYAGEHGTTHVDSSFVSSERFALGVWVRERRLDAKLGRLSGERAAALEALPGWSWEGEIAQVAA